MALSENTMSLLDERLRALPNDLRGLIIGGQFDYFVESAVIEHKLSPAQGTQLSNELLLTLLVFKPLNHIGRNLVSEVGLSQVVAKQIVKDLFGGVMQPLLLFIKSTYEETEEQGVQDIFLLFDEGRGKSKQDFLNDEMVQDYKIAEYKRREFVDLLENVVLGFNKIADLPRLLQEQVGLSREDALSLTQDLTDAWGPIVEREAKEAEAKKASVGELANKIAAIEPTKPAEGEPPTPEPTPVTPIRTMNLDAAKVHGYGAQPATSPTPAPSDEPVIKATPQDEIKPLRL